VTGRARLAWIVIGILGVVCLVVGIGRIAATGAAHFEALKFAIGGVILVVIAIYKVVGNSGRRR
jgi:membrane-bound ClpP family serine protease